MGRVCTVCTHRDKGAIDKALALGEAANRRIASQYGVSEIAVRRHASRHLPASLVEAAGAEQMRKALDVLGQLRAVNAASHQVLKQAREAKDHELTLRAIDRVMKQIELQAKLLGDLDDRPVLNVVVTPEWVALRTRMVSVLAPYPEARAALVEAIDADA